MLFQFAGNSTAFLLLDFAEDFGPPVIEPLQEAREGRHRNLPQLFACISTLPNPDITKKPNLKLLHKFPPCSNKMPHRNFPQLSACISILPSPDVTQKPPPLFPGIATMLSPDVIQKHHYFLIHFRPVEPRCQTETRPIVCIQFHPAQPRCHTETSPQWFA